mmetsp:Transcript_23418/g.47008  ORF Transcript_23418/g.47008 Transcript_23418/m.47008 type:complete len:224 (-) Transcript_23418:228-899(-)
MSWTSALSSSLLFLAWILCDFDTAVALASSRLGLNGNAFVPLWCVYTPGVPFGHRQATTLLAMARESSSKARVTADRSRSVSGAAHVPQAPRKVGHQDLTLYPHCPVDTAPLRALVKPNLVFEDMQELSEQAQTVRRNVVEQVLVSGSVTELPTREDLECLNVLTLKEICADLGLVQRGKKAELIDRIDAARSGRTEKEIMKQQKQLLRDQLEAQLRGGWKKW